MHYVIKNGNMSPSFTNNRWKRDDEGQIIKDGDGGKQVLQFVAIVRGDSGEWAIPGVSEENPSMLPLTGEGFKLLSQFLCRQNPYNHTYTNTYTHTNIYLYIYIYRYVYVGRGLDYYQMS